jgi:8-oxo-dGTP pyrophosphatase MutT (NUDIX family)
MEQLKLINLENVSDEEANGYSAREAARVIVFDGNGLVALLHATKNHYYKLPGGGIENGETKEGALKRECLEEIGCNIEITNELGFTVEYRKRFQIKQTSYCYIAKLVGEKGVPKLEKDEVEEGFEPVWLPLADAIKKVKESKPVATKIDGPYIISRDTALLESAAKMVK